MESTEILTLCKDRLAILKGKDEKQKTSLMKVISTSGGLKLLKEMGIKVPISGFTQDTFVSHLETRILELSPKENIVETIVKKVTHTLLPSSQEKSGVVAPPSTQEKPGVVAPPSTQVKPGVVAPPSTQVKSGVPAPQSAPVVNGVPRQNQAINQLQPRVEQSNNDDLVAHILDIESRITQNDGLPMTDEEKKVWHWFGPMAPDRRDLRKTLPVSGLRLRPQGMDENEREGMSEKIPLNMITGPVTQVDFPTLGRILGEISGQFTPPMPYEGRAKHLRDFEGSRPKRIPVRREKAGEDKIRNARTMISKQHREGNLASMSRIEQEKKSLNLPLKQLMKTGQN